MGGKHFDDFEREVSTAIQVSRDEATDLTERLETLGINKRVINEFLVEPLEMVTNPALAVIRGQYPGNRISSARLRIEDDPSFHDAVFTFKGTQKAEDVLKKKRKDVPADSSKPSKRREVNFPLDQIAESTAGLATPESFIKLLEPLIHGATVRTRFDCSEILEGIFTLPLHVHIDIFDSHEEEQLVKVDLEVETDEALKIVNDDRAEVFEMIRRTLGLEIPLLVEEARSSKEDLAIAYSRNGKAEKLPSQYYDELKAKRNQ